MYFILYPTYINRVHFAYLVVTGAIFEYLRSIGHPVHSEYLDPKSTLMDIWMNGGFVSDQRKSFTPHFIVREIKKRYQTVQSVDISVRLEKLLQCQEKTKRAEKEVIAEHDYTNILYYFRSMHELRALESDMRDYLIEQLETTRYSIIRR